MIDLPETKRRQQFIPTDEQAQDLILALLDEPYHYKLFYVLAMYTGCRRGKLCALRWKDFVLVEKYRSVLTVSRSRTVVAGQGVVEGPTKNGRSRTMTISYYVVSTLWSLYDFQKRVARENHRKVSPTCSPTPRGSQFIPIPLPSACERFSVNWDSPLLFICTPCATTSSPLCSMRGWTSRLWRSWQATGTPPSWSAPTAIPR